MRPSAAAIVASVVGALLAPYVIWCWAQLAARGLFLDPAIDYGLRGNVLYGSLAIVDFAATIVLMVPAAWALWKLGRERLVFHVGLALLFLVATTSLAFGLPVFNAGPWPVVSTLLTYSALPAAVWLLGISRDRIPNQLIGAATPRGSA